MNKVIGVVLAGVVLALASSGLWADSKEKQIVPSENRGIESKKIYKPYPEPDSGYVTDLAGVLSDEQEEEIERWLWQVESRTGVEMAVVTIRSIQDYKGTANSSIETFTTGLFDAYGIGNLPENDGVLLVVAVYDRKARIELGAGYERSRDYDATEIMQNKIVPYFKKNDYAGGIKAGVQGMMKEFAGMRMGINWNLIIIPVVIVVLGMIARSLFRQGKRGWGWICVGIIIVLILALFQATRTIIRHMPEGRSSSWGSGGFGGGFGGGFSGGGGATGSW